MTDPAIGGIMELRSFANDFPKDGEINALDESWRRTLEPGALARRPDFTLGLTRISPATRIISGPGGEATIEPRVMQVLLALVDAKRAVVTRDELVRRCWNGQFVGDDSIHRAIGEVRRIARTVAKGSFSVETIPKTGYRLMFDEHGSSDEASSPIRSVSRRPVIAGIAAVTATIFGGWRYFQSRPDPRAAELIARSRQILRDEMPDSEQQGIGFLREAVAIEPDNADAWGLLALAWRNVSEFAPPSETAAAVTSCETAARRALALTARQGNAHVALALLRPMFGDWLAAEQRLRAVLAIEAETSLPSPLSGF